MFYHVNLTISDEELSVIQTVLEEYVMRKQGTYVGVEFESELAQKVKVILDVKRIKNKTIRKTAGIDIL